MLRMAPTDREREKNSKFPKLSENGMITKRARHNISNEHKRLIKRSYGLKYIHGQSLVNLAQSAGDESASVLLTSSSIHHHMGRSREVTHGMLMIMTS
jgi:hypothetical protein